MTRPHWKAGADRQVSGWIDGHDGESTNPLTSSRWEEGAIQLYVADLLLVDALLADMADVAVPERDRRIRKVMEAIDTEAPVRRPPSRLARWSSLAAIAACLMIAVTIIWTQFEQHSLANETLLAIHRASSEATDRVYSIRRQISAHHEVQLPYARLYLRGRHGFVITCGEVVLGRSGDQFWLVSPGDQVTISDDFHWIDTGSTDDQLGLRVMQELSLESRHVPLMQLASVARLMQHDYDVTLIRSRLQGRAVDLLVGRRRTAKREFPETIRLWSDVESRVIQRAELIWQRENAIVLELESSEPISADWYDYQAHCDGVPKVRRIPIGS